MKLTVLGTNGPYPGPGKACSGYLVKSRKTAILLDCGSGVMGRLQYHQDFNQLTAVVVSHLHYDHISDLYVLRYALEAARQAGLRTIPLPLYALPQPPEVFASLAHEGSFELRPLEGGESLVIGDLTLSFLPTVHALPCLAVSIAGAGKRLVYSGDTEYFPELVPFVAGADLFLCEANYRRGDIEAGKSNHLAAYQAGSLAREARVNKLLLTHVTPGIDTEALLSEARAVFPYTELAREDGTYSV